MKIIISRKTHLTHDLTRKQKKALGQRLEAEKNGTANGVGYGNRNDKKGSGDKTRWIHPQFHGGESPRG